MTEMEERVSLAMAAKRRELIAQPLERIWGELACAAIEAMREPTIEMVEAHGEIPYEDDSGVVRHPSVQALLEWQAMIDAALGTKS